MRVIKDMAVIQDNWQRLEQPEVAQVLPAGDVIVPFNHWLDNRESLNSSKGHLAICINGNDEIETVAKYIQLFDLIALEFPAFVDGRSYSHARLLRERYNYTGELRAVGDVLRDQLFFMQRCGIDSFQLREDKDAKEALKAFNELSVKYQAAADSAKPIYRYR